jgi:magnesium chelatase accessory protein
MDGRLEWDVDGLAWPHRRSSTFVRAGGINWHVQSLGSGPPVALIHGTASSVHTWAGLATTLAQHFSLTMFDLPGHGFTDPVPVDEMSLRSVAHRAADLLETLGVRPRILIGHSAGASIAAQLVIDRRIARPVGIIALNGALLPFSSAASWLYPMAAKLLSTSRVPARLFAWRAGQDGATERVIRATGSRLDAQAMGYYRQLFTCDTHVQAALEMMSRWDLHEIVRVLPTLDVPLDLIACSEDLAVSPEDATRVCQLTSMGKVHYVRGVGHLAHEEDPERIGSLMQSLCNRLLACSTIDEGVGA